MDSLRNLGFAAALVMTALGANAQETANPFAAAPGTETAAFYERNRAAIGGLIQQAKEGSTDTRLSALETLANTYPDEALYLATTLVKDADEAIARSAARLLAASIVMTDHDMSKREMTPAEIELMTRVETVRAALRQVLEDPRESVRSVAAGTLASLSDEPALKIIDAAGQTGAISTVEAINYLGLARPNVGSVFLERYFRESEGPAKLAAQNYLASRPDSQAEIRDSILLNESANPDLRVAAAKVLSQYDKDYGTYALTVTSDPNVPTAVYTSILDGYANHAIARGSLSPAIAKTLRDAIENKAALSGQNMNALKKRFEPPL